VVTSNSIAHETNGIDVAEVLAGSITELALTASSEAS
jgi:hypothetical protein